MHGLHCQSAGKMSRLTADCTFRNRFAHSAYETLYTAIKAFAALCRDRPYLFREQAAEDLGGQDACRTATAGIAKIVGLYRACSQRLLFT